MEELARKLTVGQLHADEAQEKILREIPEESKVDALRRVGLIMEQGGTLLAATAELMPMLEAMAEHDSKARHYVEVGEAVMIESLERMQTITAAVIERLQR